MNKTHIKLIAIIIIVAITVGLFSGIVPLSTDYNTGLSAHTDTTWPTMKRKYEKEKGEQWISSAGREIMKQDVYIVAWQPNQMSQLISLRTDFNFNPCYGADHCNQAILNYRPGEYLGRYWFFATYTDCTGKATRIINMRENWWDTEYVEMVSVPPSGDFKGPGFYFPNAKPYYKQYDVMEGSCRQKTWWLAGGPDVFQGSLTQARDQWFKTSSHEFSFKLRGNRPGKITIDWIIEVAEVETVETWSFPPLYDDVWHDTSYEPCQDECYLGCGEGEIIIESTNAIDTAGDETTPETGIVYTKYVYEEGLTVEISVDAGFSGASLDPGEPGYGKGWKLTIYDSTASSRYSKTIDDDVRGYPVFYTIPAGAFIPNDPNDNEWRVVLRNTLFDQSETRLFVVDKFEYIPGKVTIDTDKDRYIQWETVYVTLEAYANEKADIDHFTAWAKYDSWSSTDYASQVHDYPAQNKGGGLFQAEFDFQVEKGNKYVFIRSHAIDTEGRAGPEGERKIYSEQAVGNYQIKIIVTSGGRPLPGATAKMGSKEAKSGRDGVANIYINYGLYSLSVWHDEKILGIIPKYGTFFQYGIQVQDDMEIEVSLINVLSLIISVIIFVVCLIIALVVPDPKIRVIFLILGIALAFIYYYLF